VVALQEVCQLSAYSILWSDGDMWKQWADWIRTSIRGALPEADFDLVHDPSLSRLVGLLTLVFASGKARPDVLAFSQCIVGVGFAGAGNKGCVGVRWQLGRRKWCVANVHLAAGTAAQLEREAQFDTISERLEFLLDGEVVPADSHDISLFIGDTNSRLVGADDLDAEIVVAEVASAAGVKQYLQRDQLLVRRLETTYFHDWREAPIHFTPTYRWLKSRPQMDPKRVPAWTDRILWKGPLTAVLYRSLEWLEISDHRPVECILELTPS